jgi:hypothetical protein
MSLEVFEALVRSGDVGRGVAQHALRALLLLKIGICEFCGFAVEEGLEIAHIHPYSESKDEPWCFDLNNNLLLCATHHRLFDAGLLRLDQTLRIQVAPRKALDSAITTSLYDDLNGAVLLSTKARRRLEAELTDNDDLFVPAKSNRRSMAENVATRYAPATP